MQQLPLGIRLRERTSFEVFVAGENIELVQRLRRLASGERGIVWIWGAAGLGRTHLLQAAVLDAASRGHRVGYLPCAQLPTLDAATLEGFSAFELVCLDDLDVRLEDPAVERAMFTLYRQIEERGSGLVISASQSPVSLDWHLADIASRLAAAEVFQLRPLDEEGQAEALRRRAAARGFELPDDTLRYLLRRFPRDMVSLCELLEQIDVASLSAQRRVTIPFVRETLGEP